jgi:hypothetical protein
VSTHRAATTLRPIFASAFWPAIVRIEIGRDAAHGELLVLYGR